MKLDRKSIVRSDFPSGRSGWRPAAVQAHLEEIADSLGNAQLPAGRTAPGALSEQIQGILEAAEAAAAEIERQAHAQAELIREQANAPAEEGRAQVASAAQALVGRIEKIEAELEALFSDLHTRGLAIGASIAGLEGDACSEELGFAAERKREDRASAARVQGGTGAAAASPATPLPEHAAPAIAGEDAAAKQADSHSPAEPQPVASEAPRQQASDSAVPATGSSTDTDAARLVALDMALSGESRVDIDSYLAAHFELADRSVLLNEVLAATGD